jgi:hypothetical protein
MLAGSEFVIADLPLRGLREFWQSRLMRPKEEFATGSCRFAYRGKTAGRVKENNEKASPMAWLGQCHAWRASGG